MPRLPINYQSTIIYKIVCNDLEITDLYVGHTTSFTDRKRGHKNGCINENNKNYNLKVYKMIRENGGWNNWSMIEIEKYSCHDFNEAAARERYYYEELNAKLNNNVPNRNIKGWREDHKDKTKEYNKQYHEQNKEDHNEQQKQYREENKEKLAIAGKQYREDNKKKIAEKMKQYREDNKEQIKKYRQQNYEKNKEQINEKQK